MEKISKNREQNNILKIGSKNLNSENWKVFNSEGRHMFTCGEKKATWYIERELAKKIGLNTIELTFSPKGNGFEDNEEFGRNIRESKCVVSGVIDGLQRHHIVPYCYRTFFPIEFKSKNHHDVVLINYEKHSEYEKFANDFKNEIAKIYGVKSIEELNVEYVNKLREVGKSDSILLNVIHSLFKCYGRVSNDIILDKLQFISNNTGIPFDTLCTYNYFQLYKMYLYLKEKHNEDIFLFKLNNRSLYDHGYHVVQKLDTDEKIEEFVKLWRNHFIEIMQPKYMPLGWSVDFRTKTKII